MSYAYGKSLGVACECSLQKDCDICCRVRAEGLTHLGETQTRQGCFGSRTDGDAEGINIMAASPPLVPI